MDHPRVLIGCPTSFHKAYCLGKYVEAVRAIDYPNFDFVLVDNSPDNSYISTIRLMGVKVIKAPYHGSALQRIIESRNILRQKALDEGYDYLFSLEQDVIIKPQHLKSLLIHGKPVVTGLYGKPLPDDPTKAQILLWDAVDFDKEVLRYASLAQLQATRLLKVEMAGIGCMLIHRDVLAKIPFRFQEGSKNFDDFYFCKDLKEQGMPLFADTTVQCGHMIQDHQFWRKIQY